MIEFFGAPLDLGGARQGSRLGPAALRFAGLQKVLSEVPNAKPVIDGKDVDLDLTEHPREPLPHTSSLANAIGLLRNRTQEILKKEVLPFMIGGEHSLTVGPVSAMLDKYGDQLGVLWIDAHADINTPETSDTKNIHGMPIAILQNLPFEGEKFRENWAALREAAGNPSLKPHQVAWFGIRDVDPGERARIRREQAATMHDIDRYGLVHCWERICDYFVSNGHTKLYISFDVDVLDPFLAPGTGTTVRGGLTYREAHLLAELFYESTVERKLELVGLDVVETSPALDKGNQTAAIAVEWVASLFGKSIL